MNYCDEILGWHDRGFGILSQEEYARAEERVKQLPISSLLLAWRAAKSCHRSRQTQAIWIFNSYFDGLSHREPVRACDFIIASINDEADDEVVALIGRKPLGQLLHFQGVVAQERLAPFAARSARLRWLLGGNYWALKSNPDIPEHVRTSLLPLADREAWDAWIKAHVNERVSYDRLDEMPLDDIADMWIEARGYSEIEEARDNLAAAMYEYGRQLAGENKGRCLGLIRAILARDDSPHISGSLSAGILEDVIYSEDEETLQAIEAECRVNRAFRELLHGAYYSSQSEGVRKRLDAARDGESAATSSQTR